MRRDVFQAISDPVRREIIDILTVEPLTVNEVVERFDISRPAVSKHLKILNECGIVSINKRGRERLCNIEFSSLVPAYAWLDQYKQQWINRIDSFEDYLINLKQIREKKDE